MTTADSTLNGQPTAGASQAANMAGFSGTPQDIKRKQMDKEAMLVKATRAKSAILEAFNALGEIVSAVPEEQLVGGDFSRIGFVEFLAKLQIILFQLRKLNLSVSQEVDEVSDDSVILGVSQFFHALYDLFDVDKAHDLLSVICDNKYSHRPNGMPESLVEHQYACLQDARLALAMRQHQVEQAMRDIVELYPFLAAD